MNAGSTLQCRRPRGEGLIPLVTAMALAVLLTLAPALASAAGNPPAVQTFYIPFPEDQLLAGLKAIDAGNVSTDPANPMTTYISLAAVAANTIVYYDQWENGYEYDISNPGNLYSAANPGGTQIWGDADPANGVPPGVPSDVINAGTVIILNNTVNTTTQQAVIDFDGRDKIAVTKNIAVTRTGWASGSNTLLAGSVEVYDTANWGTLYRAPVGENIPDATDYQMFSYTGLAIMAGQDGATVSVDANADGDFTDANDANGVTLAEGESRFVNGGVNVGARVVSDKPVQVDILTGDRGSAYESRDSALLPVSLWTNSYYTPVSTATVGTTVWLYNPGATSLAVTYERRVSGSLTTSSLTVPAGSYLRQVLPANTPAHFYTTGAAFYAFSTTDSTSSDYAKNQAWDWGFSLIPQGSLTPQVLIGLGIGRDPTSATLLNENGNPVWVTPIGNRNTAVLVYVDYDADPATGPNIDPNGNRYNTAYSLRELDQAKIYDTLDRNQSGLLVYVLAPGVKLAAAWGQDPATASASAPGLDVGTSVPPCPLFSDGKNGTLYTDNDGDGFITAGDELEYTVVINNISRAPVPDVILLDNLPAETTYVPNTTYNGATPIPDNTAPATAFPLDEDGTNVGTIPVGGSITVTFRVILQNPLPEDTAEIVNTGSATAVGVTIPFEDRTPLGGIGDFVWNDFDRDGIQDAGEAGIPGVTVKLYDSAGTLLLATSTTGPDGYYAFTGLDTGSYIVEFTKPAGSDPSPQDQGADDALDSDADPLTGRTMVFPWTAGEILRTIDAGFWLPAPRIEVTKTADPTSVPETGGDVTFTFVVANTGNVPATLTALSDDKFGTLAGDADCQVGTVLAPGDSCSFAATFAVPPGQYGGAHVDVFTATATGNGVTVSDTDDATVTYVDVLPVISVTKVASPLTRPEPGGEFTFTYVVTNAGTVPVVVTSVTDSVIGAITLPADVALDPGESTAAMTGKWTYTDDGVYPNTVTAVAEDDDGNEDTATAAASVTVTDTLPDIAITKDASPTVVPETGGNVEFTVVVTNNSPEAATITALTDTDFDLATFCPSAVGTVLTHGQTYTCIFTVLVSGDFESGIPHVDTATVVAADDDGNSDTDSDDATVRFTDVDPLIDVEKYVWDGTAWQDADAPAGPSLFADPLFKFVVTNTGPVALSQLTLTDLPAIAQFYAEPALTNPCAIPASLAPAGTFTCYGTLPWHAGQQADTATATGSMADGAGLETATDSDAAHYFGVQPSFTVTKACAETGPVPQEGPAHFTVTFHNDGGLDLTITADDGIGAFTLAAGATRTFDVTLPGPFTGQATADNTVNAFATYGGAPGQAQRIDRSASAACRVGSRVNVLKLTNGAVNPAQSWTFSLWTGPDGFGGTQLATADTLGDLDGRLDFANANLDRYATYTLCEENIPACWTPYWQVDTDGDGVADTSLTPYNPNADDMPPQDFGHRCADFGAGTLLSLLRDGGTLLFQVDNTHGQGEPRTPGYWKNWSTCSGGNQAAIALANGGWQAGFWLLDDVLNPAVGGGVTWDDILADPFIFPIDSCELGVSILSGLDFADGTNRNLDAAYTLAKHLLAAQANFIAGARTCDAATDAALEAETLLDKYDFDATGPFLDTWTKPLGADYAYALELAAILDQYNNGRLCVGPAVSFIEPLEGATVAGNVPVRVNATSPAGVNKVEFFIDGVSLGTDTTAGDGWSIVWDSTAVPDGSHTLAASATNALGQTSSADIVVLVDNLVDPPVVAITAPLDAATVSGASVTITADAASPSGVTQVEFVVRDLLDNIVFSVVDSVADGWSATWSLAGVVDGVYTISATATAAGGQTATDTISVTIDNVPDLTITVGSLAFGSDWFKRNVTWAATVRIGVSPALDGAVVAGMWSNGDAVTCTTGTSGAGACSVTLTGISKKTSLVTYQVTNITLPGYTYVPTAGLTSVTVNRP